MYVALWKNIFSAYDYKKIAFFTTGPAVLSPRNGGKSAPEVLPAAGSAGPRGGPAQGQQAGDQPAQGRSL